MTALPVITTCRTDHGYCGACCSALAAPPFDDAELAELDEQTRDEVLRHRSERDSYDPCPWLLPDRSCREYERRPRMCQDFERGGTRCRTLRRSKGID